MVPNHKLLLGDSLFKNNHLYEFDSRRSGIYAELNFGRQIFSIFSTGRRPVYKYNILRASNSCLEDANLTINSLECSILTGVNSFVFPMQDFCQKKLDSAECAD